MKILSDFSIKNALDKIKFKLVKTFPDFHNMLDMFYTPSYF